MHSFHFPHHRAVDTINFLPWINQLQKMASLIMGCSTTVLRPSNFLSALLPLIYSSVCLLSLPAAATKKERRKGRRDVRWIGSEDTEIPRWLSVSCWHLSVCAKNKHITEPLEFKPLCFSFSSLVSRWLKGLKGLGRTKWGALFALCAPVLDKLNSQDSCVFLYLFNGLDF